MLGLGQDVFLQLPNEMRRRFLHPAKVVGAVDGQYHVEMEKRETQVISDQEIMAFFHSGKDFVKQAARVIGDVETEPNYVITFETVGQPVSADTRECYRVSTVIAGLTVEFGRETNCPLLDVSVTGFALSSSLKYVVANIVSAKLFHEGAEYAGQVCVQSVRELGNGRIRYGVSCVDKTPGGNNLLAGTLKLSLSVQREHARRLAGVGG